MGMEIASGLKRGRRRTAAVAVRAVLLAGGALLAVSPATAGGSTGALAETSWRLVEFQSMDDAIGVVRPDDPSRYTMSLGGDGAVTMRLNCNSARGTWSAEPAGDGSSGRFEFGPLAMTRALCPPPSMDGSIAAQSQFVRSYLLSEGRLHLSLMALNMREQPSVKAPVVSRLSPGAILDNLGCRSAENRVWCDVQPLGGGARGYVSAEFLAPAVSPDGSVAAGPDDSALRAGQGDFDATGSIPCGQHEGQPMTVCEFGVARAGGGYATVVIKKPGGGTRAIFFRMGRPVGADTSEADGYGEFQASREGDLNLIHVGVERYEIPDAVVLGG